MKWAQKKSPTEAGLGGSCRLAPLVFDNGLGHTLGQQQSVTHLTNGGAA